MLQIESSKTTAAQRLLAWIFTAFAIVPFGLWTNDHLTRAEAGVLGEWPMLVVTVFFTAMSLIVSNPNTSKKLAGGMVDASVGMFRKKSGDSVPDHTHEDLPS